MKQSGFKSRGGGLKRKAASSTPVGISRTKLGELRVKDADYMKFLHDQHTPPLDLGTDTEKTGVMELHHTAPPVKHSRRRDFDSSVVPLDQADHSAIEMSAVEERIFNRAFAAWSAFSYWCYRENRAGTEEDARAFHLWCLEKMEEKE